MTRAARVARASRAFAVRVGVGVLALSALPVTGAFAAPPPAPAPAGGWTGEDAARFWTAQRMRSATPVGGGAAPVGGGARTAPKPKASAAAAYLPDGIPTVGTVYFVGRDLATHSCTASVVHSPRGNLLLTAGHCGLDDKRAFVPQYRAGLAPARQPYGIWAVDRVFRDPRRTDFGPGSDLDFAFATVKPDGRGRGLESVTGANRLARAAGYTNTVTVVGYPTRKNSPADRPVGCRVETAPLPGYRQMRMECAGFHGGTSGSPWIANFDEATKTGDVIGALGGWNGGGLLDGSDRISFAPLFGDAAFRLYDDAVAGRTPRRPALPYSPYARGAGERWAAARHTASGDYDGDGRTDTVVVWADGEVTLYRGNGRGGYGGEVQLLRKNSLWRTAAAVTGGDFTGTAAPDLLVRWPDGKVSLYADVSPNAKPTKEIVLAPKGSVWKSATQVVAGRHGADRRADDVVVRWKDGELSLYSDVGDRTKFSREKRLVGPGPRWAAATLLADGDFAGNSYGDLLVRGADGGLTRYQDVSAAGLGPGTPLPAANPLWKRPLVVTAGDYDGGGRPDDLLVRWSDGALSLRTGAGTERGLVPPKVK
ncbi:trypsin-like serine peptidase [Streptomyces sp. NPDC050504]|uniref:trypsin-like serine peptidase n=1 Tax=Streptomyces sp. NPDC050504 TaxID=3365618 RepID=UPI0037B2FFBA